VRRPAARGPVSRWTRAYPSSIAGPYRRLIP
jgi:hypothetical protein